MRTKFLRHILPYESSVNPTRGAVQFPRRKKARHHANPLEIIDKIITKTRLSKAHLLRADHPNHGSRGPRSEISDNLASNREAHCYAPMDPVPPSKNTTARTTINPSTNHSAQDVHDLCSSDTISDDSGSNSDHDTRTMALLTAASTGLVHCIDELKDSMSTSHGPIERSAYTQLSVYVPTSQYLPSHDSFTPLSHPNSPTHSSVILPTLGLYSKNASRTVMSHCSRTLTATVYTGPDVDPMSPFQLIAETTNTSVSCALGVSILLLTTPTDRSCLIPSSPYTS